MTPLAQKIARELTLPVKQRVFDNERVLSLFNQDMHCFDITAIAKPISDAMDEGNVWPDVSSILPNMFLPSPVTWLEYVKEGRRVSHIVEMDGERFRIAVATCAADRTPFAVDMAFFKSCSVLQSADRIAVEIIEEDDKIDDFTSAKTLPNLEELKHRAYMKGCADARQSIYDSGVGQSRRWLEARKELLTGQSKAVHRKLSVLEAKEGVLGAVNSAIAFSVLAVDLINTPGIVGMRQHAPHAGLARNLASHGIGKYPLRGWSEVAVKTHTTFDEGEYESGATFRKCLHFVRSHKRHYRDGKVTIIPAHWRGDPALGIKRTRYKVTA